MLDGKQKKGFIGSNYAVMSLDFLGDNQLTCTTTRSRSDARCIRRKSALKRAVTLAKRSPAAANGRHVGFLPERRVLSSKCTVRVTSASLVSSTKLLGRPNSGDVRRQTIRCRAGTG